MRAEILINKSYLVFFNYRTSLLFLYEYVLKA